MGRVGHSKEGGKEKLLGSLLTVRLLSRWRRRGRRCREGARLWGVQGANTGLWKRLSSALGSKVGKGLRRPNYLPPVCFFPAPYNREQTQMAV